MLTDEYPDNFIRMLGTAGGRISVIKQVRASGGIWFRYGGLTAVIDPGPGSLWHVRSSAPPLNPEELDCIFLTHKHLDHSTDINIMIEAMSSGGFKPRGNIILPRDAAWGGDPVLLKHSHSKVLKIICPFDGREIKLKNGVTAEPVKHHHGDVECFGWIFKSPCLPTWGLISDTKPMDYFALRYRECDIILMNVIFLTKRPNTNHTSLEDAAELLQEISPKLVVFTHMGGSITENNPHNVVQSASNGKSRLVAATDGMVIDIKEFQIF